MDKYHLSLSTVNSSVAWGLNEQIARHVFDILPDNGPVVVIRDCHGNCWPSDSEKFHKLNLSEVFLKELCGKIDDGEEPVLTQVNDVSITAAQLTTRHTKCGYVIVALTANGPESALINSDLIEIVLNQINIIAKLIEKNNLLYELKMKHSTCTVGCGASKESLN